VLGDGGQDDDVRDAEEADERDVEQRIAQGCVTADKAKGFADILHDVAGAHGDASGRDADRGDQGDGEDVAQAVGEEEPALGEVDEEGAGHRGTDRAGAVEEQGVQRDRVGEVGLAGQLDDERLPRGDIEGDDSRASARRRRGCGNRHSPIEPRRPARGPEA
jgi:hypothetical protein